MKPPERALRELVLQWLEKAGQDFDVAEQLCAQGGRFRETVAFHCQQAAEKYLKAFLVRHQIEFPKTHDIAKLLDRVAVVNAALADSLRDADALTPFGVEVRYPSDAPEILPGGELEAIDRRLMLRGRQTGRRRSESLVGVASGPSVPRTFLRRQGKRAITAFGPAAGRRQRVRGGLTISKQARKFMDLKALKCRYSFRIGAK